ncbi:MAG: helix-turn-helix domain-containing protein [Planctomycetota bacterium]
MSDNLSYSSDGNPTPLIPLTKLLDLEARELADYFTRQILRYHFLLENPFLVDLLQTFKRDGLNVSSQVVKKIHRVMSAEIRQHHGKRNSFPFNDWHDPTWFGKGDIELGQLLDFTLTGLRTTATLRIFSESIYSHMLIAATTNVGKSHLAYAYLEQAFCIVRRSNPAAGLWVWELRKDETPTLFFPFAEAGIDLQLLPWEELKFNFLTPPQGVTPASHSQFLARMLANTWELGQPGEMLLQVCLDALYARCLSRPTIVWPTMFDLREEVDAAMGRNAEAKKSVLLRIDHFLSVFKDRVAYSSAYTPDNLDSAAICFRMQGLLPMYQAAIMTYFIAGANSYRIATNQYDKPLIICVEEAGNLLYGTEAENSQRQVFELAEFSRAQRIALVFMAQQSGNLPEKLLNVLRRRIVGLMWDKELTRVLSGVCTRKQIEWAIKNLRNRWFVLAVDMEDGRRTAVVFRSKDFEVGRRPAASEVPNSFIRNIPLVSFAVAPGTSVGAPGKAAPVPLHNLPQIVSKACPPVLPPQALRLIEEVANFPDRAVSQHAVALGLSDVAVSRIITALKKADLVCEHDAYTGFTSHYFLLELLELSMSLLNPALRATYNAILAPTRRNGFLHGSFQRRGAAHYTHKGSTVGLEVPYSLPNGHNVFVDMVKNGVEAFEFELSTNGASSAAKISAIASIQRGYLVVSSQKRIKIIQGNIVAYKNIKRLDVVTFKDLCFEPLPQYSADGVLIG